MASIVDLECSCSVDNVSKSENMGAIFDVEPDRKVITLLKDAKTNISGTYSMM